MSRPGPASEYTGLHDLLAPARRAPRHRRRTAPHYLVASRCTNRSDTPHAAAIFVTVPNRGSRFPDRPRERATRWKRPPGPPRRCETPSSTVAGRRRTPPSSTTRGRAQASGLAGGGRGLLPGPPRPRAEPGRGTHRPGPRRRPRPRAVAGVRGGGPGRRPRHLPPAAASRPTGSPLERGRLDAVIAGLLFHGRDAPEVSALRWPGVTRRPPPAGATVPHRPPPRAQARPSDLRAKPHPASPS